MSHRIVGGDFTVLCGDILVLLKNKLASDFAQGLLGPRFQIEPRSALIAVDGGR